MHFASINGECGTVYSQSRTMADLLFVGTLEEVVQNG